MATSKVNIFNSLPQHASDSEDEDFNTKNKKTTGQVRSTKTDAQKTVKKTTTAPKEQKEDTTQQKDTRKTKGVSDQPHPLDRQSGTGASAYGGKPKKGGAGKGNWGKSTDEKEVTEEAGEEAPEKVEEEEKPEGITLQEYLQSQKRVENKPQVNQAKASITSEQLIKELGKSTLLKSKNKVVVDDHKVGRKKEHLDVNHRAGIATDFADLLGFRTGFIEKDFKPREPRGEKGEEGQRRAPRTEGNRRREDAKEEEKPVTEGTTTEVQQGEQPTTTTTATTEEGQARRNEGQRDNRRGGNRGGYNKQGNRGGDRPQGDRPRGDRPQGVRKPQEAKINIEDESAFPKLG